MFIAWKGRIFIMFRGEILGVMYYSWNAYKKAWNEAVLDGKLFRSNGRKATKLYNI